MEEVGQTKTENGATAWSTEVLGKDISQNPQFAKLVGIMTSLWSATGMSPDTIKDYINQFITIIGEIQESEPEDADNFMALILAFTLHRRSARHGGGRKDESRAALIPLCETLLVNKPELVRKFLTHYFTEGYWKDAWLLLKESNLSNELRICTEKILVSRLKEDHRICKLKLTKGDDERQILIAQLSNCAKFCPQVKGKKNKKNGSKSKDYITTILPLAKLLFPEIEPDTWYYKNVGGKIDTSKKHPVTEKTAAYYKWRTLLQKYNQFMKEIRDQIPFVEKYMQQGEFHSINPNMLTSKNKLMLDATLKNKPPRYLQVRGRGTKSKIPTKKIAAAREKYGAETRYESNPDRQELAIKYIKYEEEVAKKQQEKMEKMQEMRTKMQELAADSSAEAKAELQKMREEMQQLQDEKITNFSAGTPIDVLKAYGGDREPNMTYEACITEMVLSKFAALLELSILNISDTSGSMSNGCGEIAPIEVCTAMTAFFAMHAPIGWRNKYIQFAEVPVLRDVEGTLGHKPSFIEFCKYMTDNPIHDMSTNFEAVLEMLKSLFRGANPKDLPKYIIFWSDMQFNNCVRLPNQNLTAAELLKKLFVEILGFEEKDVPTIIFWNLNAHDNRPALASDEGVVMLSGFNPQMLLDLNDIIANAVTQDEFDAKAAEFAQRDREAAQALYEEQERQRKIDTWTTIVGTLSGSKATVPFLTEIGEGLLNHTLLGKD